MVRGESRPVPYICQPLSDDDCWDDSFISCARHIQRCIMRTVKSLGREGVTYKDMISSAPTSTR